MAAATALAALPTLCATTILPVNAILQFGGAIEPITLAQEAVIHAPCPTLLPRTDADSSADSDGASLTSGEGDRIHRVSDFRDPFYATQFPMCYALAATTVTAYMLVIMLFVTPRSFLDGGIVYLGRRGFTNGSSGSVNIGGRPWLQKVAALTVAISLTVATVDTFKVAELHYKWGIQNAGLMQRMVMGSVELKVVRLVSDTFLWLAQAQTLIRLFPRQREKIIIKWTAFALIVLDVIFSALNSFQYSVDGVSASPPRDFVQAVPALSYLFQLSLGILYAAWVIYYSFMKKRYAFYHPLMKNVCLVALMSIVSVLIPIVFFILDIIQPDFAGWGDYVRWVGAAAASVVVWEWVERIEALEREEKKDGILGREVFDGDDTLEVNASDFPWFRQRKNRREGGDGDGDRDGGEDGGSTAPDTWPSMTNVATRSTAHTSPGRNGPQQQMAVMGNLLRPQNLWPTRPAPVATPVSRTDTASAASTVYAVRYQPAASDATRTPDPLTQASVNELSRQMSPPRSYHTNEDAVTSDPAPASNVLSEQINSNSRTQSDDVNNNSSSSQSAGRSLAFAPPPELSRGHEDEAADQPNHQHHTYKPAHTRSSGSRWGMRAKLEEFAANQAEKMREKIRPTTDTENLPVTVIPAPPRRGAALQQVLEEEERENGEAQESNGRGSRHGSVDVSRLDRIRSGASVMSRRADELPADNPPLWPGVQPRLMYDDDDYSYDGDSVSDISSSVVQERRGSSDGWAPGPSRRS